MKILARGEKIQTEELRQKLSSAACELTVIDDTDLISVNLSFYDLIIDLTFDEHPGQLKYYAGLSIPVIVSAAKVQLAAAVHQYGNAVSCVLIGMNCLPTFINRPLAEVSLWQEKHRPTLGQVMEQLGWQYRVVEDRVGMVTPRVIFMIINEACYTVQEGTASIADIDTSMKLGTNYPYGPFEWADRVGIKHVYETLAAVYEDTKEERYKICPLLRTKYLKNESFHKG
jgi:3-hydroxybutyryl-CoA dehydrogenase